MLQLIKSFYELMWEVQKMKKKFAKIFIIFLLPEKNFLSVLNKYPSTPLDVDIIIIMDSWQYKKQNKLCIHSIDLMILFPHFLFIYISY
jgi:hypothetical protein